MNIILMIVSVVVPLLPVVLFPTRFFGKGVASTVVGATMLVGMMMLIYFGLNGLTEPTPPADKDAVAASSLNDADMSALQNLLGG